MSRTIPWHRTLNAKLGGVVALLLAASVALITINVLLLDRLQGAGARQALMGQGPYYGYRILAEVRQLTEDSGGRRMKITAELREAMAINLQRYQTLLDGDPAQKVSAVEDPTVRVVIQTRANKWRTVVMPAVERVVSASTPEASTAAIDALEPLLEEYADVTAGAPVSEQAALRAQQDEVRVLQFVFAGVVALIVGMVLWVSRGITRRVATLAQAAERVAGGDLDMAVRIQGSDELAMLGDAFDSMTSNLRDLIATEKQARERVETLLQAIVDTANRLASSTAEILAGTSQQAAGAQEQAAAVSQTVATVDEVTQTAQQAMQRAKAVAEASQRSVEVGKAGRKAVDDAVTSMNSVREQTESIAESILALAEQAQSIGEIIATVNEIAEQTNLLALNAGIEASRAGEHGKGFSVVAGEVKALADQSKKATAQVRQILGEIQKATNRSVMTAEEGSKSVKDAIRIASEAGGTIRALAEVINEAAQAAAQISASAGQQSAGMNQIHQAMKNIDQVTNQNVASARQAERAAHDLSALGTKLKALLT